jgi:hypothetical protein
MLESFEEMVARRTSNTTELLGYAALLSTSPLEQSALLIGAATVLIEREVGTVMAGPALMALIEPSVAEWQRSADKRADTGR